MYAQGVIVHSLFFYLFENFQNSLKTPNQQDPLKKIFLLKELLRTLKQRRRCIQIILDIQECQTKNTDFQDHQKVDQSQLESQSQDFVKKNYSDKNTFLMWERVVRPCRRWELGLVGKIGGPSEFQSGNLYPSDRGGL